jgi:putative aldouronate transport system substrate-binding protein
VAGMTSGDVSRRAVLRMAGGVLLGAASVPLVAACAPGAPAASSASKPATAGTSGAVSGAGTSGGKVKLPTYGALPNLPPADLPGTPDGLLAPGYQKYPTNLIKSVPTPPGKGGEVNGLTASLSTPPTALENNPAWQQVNKELNVTLRIPSISTADFPTRLGTVLAGSDLPDIIAAAIFSTTMPNIADFLNSACADLTPYLSGDAVKDYPNLANLPSSAWPPMVYNNKIMAVPVSAGGVRQSPILLARWGDVEKAGISKIGSPDEFMGVCKQLNNPGTRWALGANTLINWLAMVYGAPNMWRETGGKFTRDYETPEYKEAVTYHRALWDAGLFHPDSPSLQGSPAGVQYYGGKFVFSPHASWSLVAYQTAWERANTADPNFKPRAVLPFNKEGTGRAGQFVGTGATGTVALKKASADRIKELLGVLNYLAAPVGTSEALLLQYGVEGPDFTRDANGNPSPTPQGLVDTVVPWKNVSGPPDFLFSASSDQYVPVTYAAQKEHFATVVPNPTVGLYSPTDGSKGIVLKNAFNDRLLEIVFGKQPVSAYDDLVKEWRTNGGDAIRAEYEAAFQANK